MKQMSAFGFFLIVVSAGFGALDASAANLTWNGADGASWHDVGVWQDEQGEAATFADGDVVTFPANATPQTVVVDVEAKPQTLVIEGGDWTFTGQRRINPSGGSISAPKDCVWIKSGRMTLANDSSGDRSMNNDKFYYVDTGSTLVLQVKFTSPSNADQRFQGPGDLIVDGMMFDMGRSGAYNSAVSALSGRLEFRNGAKVHTTGNSSSEVFGKNTTVLFGGLTVTMARQSNSFGSKAYEIVAGTTNEIQGNEKSFPLDLVTVIAEPSRPLDPDQEHMVLKAARFSGEAKLSDELKSAGWALRQDAVGSDAVALVLYLSRGEVTWQGADGADWTTENAWRLASGAPTTYAEHDTALFPAHEGEPQMVRVDSTVNVAVATVSGAYAFDGTGSLSAGRLSVTDNATLSLKSPALYAGGFDLAATGCLELDFGAGTASLGALTVADEDGSKVRLVSGTVELTQVTRAIYEIGESTELVLKGDYSSGRHNATTHFLGLGSLVVDGCLFDMNKGDAYGHDMKSVQGSVTLRNGATVSLDGNSNGGESNLGSGKVVLAGSKVIKNNRFYLKNAPVEVKAGTTNVFVDGSDNYTYEIPLTHVTVVGDPGELDSRQEYEVLSAMSFADGNKVGISPELRAAGWRLRIDVEKDGEGVVVRSGLKMYRQCGFMVVIY